MIIASGPLEPRRASQLLVERRREVAGVEEPRLGVDARLLLERGTLERAVDQEERARRRTGSATGSSFQRVARADAERREDELGREALEREEPGLPDRVARARSGASSASSRWFAPTMTIAGDDAGEREAEVAASGDQ